MERWESDGGAMGGRALTKGVTEEWRGREDGGGVRVL